MKVKEHETSVIRAPHDGSEVVESNGLARELTHRAPAGENPLESPGSLGWRYRRQSLPRGTAIAFEARRPPPFSDRSNTPFERCAALGEADVSRRDVVVRGSQVFLPRPDARPAPAGLRLRNQQAEPQKLEAALEHRVSVVIRERTRGGFGRPRLSENVKE